MLPSEPQDKKDEAVMMDSTVAVISASGFKVEITNGISDSLFYGKRSDRCKGLLWMGTGFLLLYKRFEDGRLF